MLNELAGLDGFSFILDYFLPIGCLIIGWCNFLINKENLSEIEKFVNFSVALFFSFMFIFWLLFKIIALVK
jgi:hypothetical protein